MLSYQCFFMNKTSRAIKWFCYRKYVRHRNVDTNMYVPFNLQNSDIQVNSVNSVNSSTPDYTWDRTIPIYFHQTAYHKLAQYVTCYLSWIFIHCLDNRCCQRIQNHKCLVWCAPKCRRYFICKLPWVISKLCITS